MKTRDIEARAEAATPLTDEEYAEWKANLDAIAEMEAGEWYKRVLGEGFVLTSYKPTGEITTTIGIQQRLFAIIGAGRAKLKTAKETLAAVEKLRVNVARSPSRDDEWWIEELDRILKGGA